MLKKMLCMAFFVFLAASMMNNAFATVIFADGFESGSFSRWSGTVRTYGETASVVYGGIRHHGLRSARFFSNGDFGYEKAYCYKNIPQTPDIYVRGYFYVSRSGIMEYGGPISRIFFIVLKPVGASGAAYIGWEENPANSYQLSWVLNCRNGASYSKLVYHHHNGWPFSQLNPHERHWFCVELHWKMGVTNGYAEAWINGHYIGRTSYRNTAYYGAINQVQFGLPQLYECGSTIAYGDCARISTSYIGPEY